MANYVDLAAQVAAVVKTNGVQGIHGDNLQAQLLSMISSLGKYYQMGGVVNPSDSFTPGDENVCFIGATPGVYTNFGGFSLASGQVAAFLWNGVWRKEIISYYGNVQVYGIRHFYNQASPDLTRIGPADLHRDLPVQSQMRRCIVDDTGSVVYYLHPDDSTKKANGSAADLSGGDGQYMVEIPKHYRKATFNQGGGYLDVEISLLPFSGAVVVPRSLVSADEAVLDRDTNKLCAIVNTATRYRGGNNTADWDGTYKSLLGLPVTNISLTDFRTYARNRGTNWGCYDYNIHLALFWLYAIEYATLNSQKAFNANLDSNGFHQGGLGPGVSNFSNWGNYNNYNPIIPCGFTASLGNHTGVKTWTADATAYGSEHTESVPSYRGVTNPFGHIAKWVDGVLCMGNGTYQEVWVCRTPSKYASSITGDYVDLGHEATSNGYCKAIIATSGDNIAQREYGDIFDRDDSGSDSTYFCDYHYHDNTEGGLRAVFVGGVADDGGSGGFCAVSANNSVADAGRSIGSRLCWSE